LDKRHFDAYKRRLIALREARSAYIEAEIEHLTFRDKARGVKRAMSKKAQTKLRNSINSRCLLIEIDNLALMNQRLPGGIGDHHKGDGCVKEK
jgi:hypothetical protein